MSQPMTPQERETRLSIGFINWAHALDHYVMLIFPTVVIGLELVYGRSYAELIALGTASFVAFGIFSLPAGWLADRWSRRNMMVMFYAGCGLALVGAGFAPNLVGLAVALFALGVFAAIYHPVGTAMLIEQATARGRSLAFNGVCGNVGAALAAGVTAALAAGFGWRAAFLVPGVICIATAVVYLRLVPKEERKAASRGTVADVPLGFWLAATIFGLFIVIALCAGLVFNIISVALPKILDERLGSDVPLILVGGVATAVFLCGAFAQLAVGRLVEKFPPHILFAVIASLQFLGVLWAAQASGKMLIVALAVAMAAIYAQVTVNDLVDRALHRGRLARPRLRGAILPHIPGVGGSGFSNRPSAWARGIRPRPRHDGPDRARLRGRDRRDRGPGQWRREGAHAGGGAGGIIMRPCGTFSAFLHYQLK